jgi:hypothetical protein
MSVAGVNVIADLRATTGISEAARRHPGPRSPAPRPGGTEHYGRCPMMGHAEDRWSPPG